MASLTSRGMTYFRDWPRLGNSSRIEYKRQRWGSPFPSSSPRRHRTSHGAPDSSTGGLHASVFRSPEELRIEFLRQPVAITEQSHRSGPGRRSDWVGPWMLHRIPTSTEPPSSPRRDQGDLFEALIRILTLGAAELGTAIRQGCQNTTSDERSMD